MNQRTRFLKGVTDLVAGVDLLWRNRLVLPSAMLLYATIDVLAALDSEQSEQNHVSFTKWVGEFLLPSDDLPLTAEDLYGARCGLIHAYSSHSNLARQGRARKVAYSWGSFPTAPIEQLPDIRNGVTVHITYEALLRGFSGGVTRFLDRLQADSSRGERVYARADTEFFLEFVANAGS